PVLRKVPCLSPDGTLWLSPRAGRAGVTLVDTDTNKVVWSTLLEKGTFFASAWSPDGRFLFISSHDSLHIWDRETNAISRKVQLPGSGPGARVDAIGTSANGQRVVVGNCCGEVYVYEICTNKIIHKLQVSRFEVTEAALTPDGNYV